MVLFATVLGALTLFGGSAIASASAPRVSIVQLLVRSAVDEIHAWVEPAQVVGVAGHGHPIDDASNEHDRCVDDVRGGSCRAQLSCRAGADRVERMDRYAFRRDDAHKPNLARRVSPRLGERAGWHVDVVSQLQQADHPPIGPIDSDEGARVKDYRPRTLRAHLVSSSVAGPSSVRIWARTVRQALAPGPLSHRRGHPRADRRSATRGDGSLGRADRLAIDGDRNPGTRTASILLLPIVCTGPTWARRRSNLGGSCTTRRIPRHLVALYRVGAHAVGEARGGLPGHPPHDLPRRPSRGRSGCPHGRRVSSGDATSLLATRTRALSRPARARG